MNSQSNRHTHYQAAPANAQTKAWQRVCLSHPDKIELKKPSLPSENKKYATAQTDTTRTVKRTIDNGLQGRTTEHQPVTSVTVAQLLFLENSFQKHKILTSLEAILERFIF